jgi:hypothetical protein
MMPQEPLPLDEGINGNNTVDTPDALPQAVVFGDGITFDIAIDIAHGDMGIYIENFILDLGLETVHDRNNHDEDKNPDSHNEHGKKRIKRDETLALFRFQIPETDEQFI